MFWTFVKAFVVGGIFCVIGQLLVDLTKLTPARILTIYVIAGLVLTAVGVYKPIVDWAGAGATVPLTGFGYLLATGVKEAVKTRGFLGIFSGGVTAASAGITAVVVFGYVVSLLSKPADKS